MHRNRFTAFTLSELLIALAVLGVIAVFTIPKVLQSQQDTKYKSMAKEAAGAVSDALTAYKQKYPLTGTTTAMDLFGFINYVKLETGLISGCPTEPATYDCSTKLCLRMHNGGILWLSDIAFNGTANTNVTWFLFDPDGTSSPTNARGIWFALHANGRLSTWATIDPNADDNTGNAYTQNPANDPDWFNWN